MSDPSLPITAPARDARHPPDAARLRRVAVACRRLVEKLLPRYLDSIQEKIDDTIYGLVSQSGGDEFQTDFYSALRTVRGRWPELRQDFLRGLLGRYDRFWSRSGLHDLDPEAQLAPGQLQLMDETDLEERLAVSNIVAKAESRYHRELALASARVGHLAGEAQVANADNPLAPKAICDSFREVVHALEVAGPVRLVLYRLLETVLVERLGGFYDQLNAFFEQFGVLPGLRMKDIRMAERPETAAPAPEKRPLASADRQRAAVKGAVFQRLQDVLHRYRDADGQAAAGQAEAEQPDLIDALSSIQERSLGAQSFANNSIGLAQIHDVRRRLIDKIQNDGANPRHLKPVTQDTIDVVTMLFEFILGDQAIPDPLKVLLVRLQIPMLKVAVIDPGFFDEDRHPARNLLNSLAYAAARWTDDGDRSGGSLYGRIEAVVNRILLEFDQDATMFEAVNQEFNGSVIKELQSAEVSEERTVQTLRGKEKLEVVKLRVKLEIDRRLRGRKVLPPVVRTLLEQGWKDVLLLIGLRQGRDSEEWKQALRVMDRLLWSVAPETGRNERQKLLQEVPRIVRELREGLVYIAFDAAHLGHLLKELQMVHIANIRGKLPPTPAGGQASEPPRESERTPTPKDLFARKALDLPIGAWLELTDVDGQKRRIKLCWKSEVSDAYVFVNRRGQKVAELGLEELGGLFRNHRAELLRDIETPLTDRALSYMMQTLEKSGKAGAHNAG